MLPALRRFLSGASQAPGSKARGRSTGTAASSASGNRGSRAAEAASFEDEVLFIIFSSNLAGIVFARSIHYQFYSW